MHRGHVQQCRWPLGQPLGAQSAGVHRNADHIGGRPGQGARGQRIAGILHHGPRAWPQRHLKGDMQRLLASVHDHHLVRRNRQPARRGQPRGDAGAQRRTAVRQLGAELPADAVERATDQRAPAHRGEQRRVGMTNPGLGPGARLSGGGRERRLPLRQSRALVQRRARHEGPFRRHRLEVAFGDQPLIGQHDGDTRYSVLFREHTGGRHARTWRQPRRGDEVAQLVVELPLQRLIARKAERKPHYAAPDRVG